MKILKDLKAVRVENGNYEDWLIRVNKLINRKDVSLVNVSGGTDPNSSVAWILIKEEVDDTDYW